MTFLCSGRYFSKANTRESSVIAVVLVGSTVVGHLLRVCEFLLGIRQLSSFPFLSFPFLSRASSLDRHNDTEGLAHLLEPRLQLLQLRLFDDEGLVVEVFDDVVVGCGVDF